MIVLELFSGIGGFHHALKAVRRAQAARATSCLKWLRASKLHLNISALVFPSLHVLLFSCIILWLQALQALPPDVLSSMLSGMLADPCVRVFPAGSRAHLPPVNLQPPPPPPPLLAPLLLLTSCNP
jgi:hypothetical protein